MTIKTLAETVPEAVMQSSLKLVEAVNESGPRCVGVVVIVVFDDTERVLPVIDRDVRSTEREDPVLALLETAAAAVERSIVRRSENTTTTPKN